MTVWSLAWRTALARKRLFVWNVAVPMLLLAPVALSDAAAPHRTAVFGVFFIFFATFGSAIPTVRDARTGWLDAIFLTGYSRRRWFAEAVLAGTALDIVQLLPVTIVLVWTAGTATGEDLGDLAVAMVVALATANILGRILAAIVQSLAEAALVSAAVSLLLLHFAGFFRTPVAGWTREVARWNPYRPLQEALAGVQASGGAPSEGWFPALLVAVIAALLVAVLARVWTRRLEWPNVG